MTAAGDTGVPDGPEGRGEPVRDAGGDGPEPFPAPAERSRLGRLADLLLTAGALAVLGLALVWLTLPEPLPLERSWPETTAYIELRREQARADGRELDLRWEPVPLGRVPDHVRRAVRVAEDAMFYRHGGVDWHEVRATVREWWTEEESLRGASTITMQLARNLYLSPERSLWRKLRETLLAWRLERRLSKGRILELYLSTVELGPGVFGVEAAARHYWGVPVGALDRRRAAELAATLPSPLEDNPRTRTRRFLWRADLITKRAFGADTLPSEAPFPAEGLPPDTASPLDTLAPDTAPADGTPADTAGREPAGAPPDTAPADRTPADTARRGAAGTPPASDPAPGGVPAEAARGDISARTDQ